MRKHIYKYYTCDFLKLLDYSREVDPFLCKIEKYIILLKKIKSESYFYITSTARMQNNSKKYLWEKIIAFHEFLLICNTREDYPLELTGKIPQTP